MVAGAGGGVIICNLYPIMDYGLANTPVWTLAAQLPSQVFISSFSSCGEKEGEHTITFLAVFSAAGAAVRGPTQTRSSSVSLTADVITTLRSPRQIREIGTPMQKVIWDGRVG